METFAIRHAEPIDAAELAQMRAALWPEGSLEEHRREVEEWFAHGPAGTLPAAVFVSRNPNESLNGFLEVSLRSHADGCDPAQPVGYVEGWFVLPELRGRGIGAALMRAAEDWARTHGAREIASDALIDNEPSQLAHAALGFEVVDRCVHLRKSSSNPLQSRVFQVEPSPSPASRSYLASANCGGRTKCTGDHSKQKPRSNCSSSYNPGNSTSSPCSSAATISRAMLSGISRLNTASNCPQSRVNHSRRSQRDSAVNVTPFSFPRSTFGVAEIL